MALDFNSGYGLLAKQVVLSFVRAFVGSLIVLVPGILAAPDFSTAKALGIAAVIAAFTAGLRAVQALFARGDHPAPATGAPALKE
jgi:hypothetical protein